jgi:hypothetical protein
VFPVEVEPVVGLEDLVRKLGEAQAAIGIGLVDGQSRLDAISRQQFVHPRTNFNVMLKWEKHFLMKFEKIFFVENSISHQFNPCM